MTETFEVLNFILLLWVLWILLHRGDTDKRDNEFAKTLNASSQELEDAVNRNKGVNDGRTSID